MDSDLLKYISICYRYARMQYAGKLEEIGVNSGLFMFIKAVCENEGCPQDALCKILKMNKSTVARAVCQLAREGMLVRRQHEADKRVYHLYSTKQAKAIYPDIVTLLAETQTAMLDGFTQDECVMLSSFLCRAAENAVKNKPGEGND